jgi:hypothetical protein
MFDEHRASLLKPPFGSSFDHRDHIVGEHFADQVSPAFDGRSPMRRENCVGQRAHGIIERHRLYWKDVDCDPDVLLPRRFREGVEIHEVRTANENHQRASLQLSDECLVNQAFVLVGWGRGDHQASAPQGEFVQVDEFDTLACDVLRL